MGTKGAKKVGTAKGLAEKVDVFKPVATFAAEAAQRYYITAYKELRGHEGPAFECLLYAKSKPARGLSEIVLLAMVSNSGEGGCNRWSKTAEGKAELSDFVALAKLAYPHLGYEQEDILVGHLIDVARVRQESEMAKARKVKVDTMKALADAAFGARSAADALAEVRAILRTAGYGTCPVCHTTECNDTNGPSCFARIAR